MEEVHLSAEVWHPKRGLVVNKYNSGAIFAKCNTNSKSPNHLSGKINVFWNRLRDALVFDDLIFNCLTLNRSGHRIIFTY